MAYLGSFGETGEGPAALRSHLGFRQSTIVTEITAAPTFWPAETYHQDFFANNPGNPYCRAWIPPKLRKLGLTDQDK